MSNIAHVVIVSVSVVVFTAMPNLLAEAPTSAPSGVVEVDYNSLKITVDAATGGIRRLSYPATGTILEASRETAGLLDVAYPIAEFVPLRLGTRHSKARVVADKNGMTITWDPLGPSRTKFPMPPGKVVAEARIVPAPDGRSVILRCTIDNQSQTPVPQVLFPDLRGLKPFAGPDKTNLRFPIGYPVYPFMEDPIPQYSAQYYVNSGWKEYVPSTGVYGTNTLRWLDYGGYAGGLSIFQKAWRTGERPIVRTYRGQADPMSLRLMWDYKTGVGPGKSWQSDEVWLTPHPGGWAKGIETYREYVKTVHPQRPLPKRIRDGLGFRTVFMIQEPERDPDYAAFRFADIPRLAADAREHGLNEVVLWGWCHYFSLPYVVRQELGTKQEFIDGVRKAKELGVNVAPFVSNVLVRREFAERYGGSPGNPAWVYHPDLIPMMDPYYLGSDHALQYWNVFSVDPHNKNWQADVTATFKDWVDQGITCWGWDQVFADAPGSDPPGLTDLLLSLRKMARAKDSEATFSGEQVGAMGLENDAGLLDFTWNWQDYIDAAPTTNLFRAPRLNCNLEDSPRIVKAAFADNLFLNAFPRRPDQPNGTALIVEKPAMAAALKEVAGLRRTFLPYFTEGVFLGDSVLSEANPGLVRGYQLGNRLLVIVLNNQPATAPFTVKSSLGLWLPKADRYQVRYYGSDGRPQEPSTWQKPEWTGTTKPLQPLELAFFEIQAR